MNSNEKFVHKIFNLTYVIDSVGVFVVANGGICMQLIHDP